MENAEYKGSGGAVSTITIPTASSMKMLPTLGP